MILLSKVIGLEELYDNTIVLSGVHFTRKRQAFNIVKEVYKRVKETDEDLISPEIWDQQKTVLERIMLDLIDLHNEITGRVKIESNKT